MLNVYGGYVTSQGITKAERGPHKFGVGIGNKQYINCDCWHDNLLTGIEARDEVLVFGTPETREYNGKTYENVKVFAVSLVRKGEKKDTSPSQSTDDVGY